MRATTTAAALVALLLLGGCVMEAEDRTEELSAAVTAVLDDVVGATGLPATTITPAPGVTIGCEGAFGSDGEQRRIHRTVAADLDVDDVDRWSTAVQQHLEADGWEQVGTMENTSSTGQPAPVHQFQRDDFFVDVIEARGSQGAGVNVFVLSPCAPMPINLGERGARDPVPYEPPDAR